MKYPGVTNPRHSKCQVIQPTVPVLVPSRITPEQIVSQSLLSYIAV